MSSAPQERRHIPSRTALRRGIATLCLALVAGASALAVGSETALMLPQAEYPVPAILALPDAPASRVPAVLLLHGTASQKNEVGDLYQRLAGILAERGIASLRIDFAGTGDSTVGYEKYTLGSAVRDARTALAYLRERPEIDGSPVAVLGFSQGGLIAQRVAIAEPSIVALATWSTAAVDGAGSFAEFFKRYYGEALQNGYARVSVDWLPEPLHFSRQWFEEMREQRTLSEMRSYQRPILAIAGLADATVPHQQSVALVAQSAHPESRAVLLAGADHTFNVLVPAEAGVPGRSSHAQLLHITASWLATHLR